MKAKALSFSLFLLYISIMDTAAADGDKITLKVSSVFQLGENTDAFSSITYLGNGICLAGKRSWACFSPYKAIYRSIDSGKTWLATENPVGITGAHVYFFGQNESTVIVGTGDEGNVVLMRSSDFGATWSVILTSKEIASLTGSEKIKALFTPLYFGNNRWLINLRNDDSQSDIFFLESLDDGITWHPFYAKGLVGSARKVMQTSDGTLVYSGFKDGIWISKDDGVSWSKKMVCNAFSGQADLGEGVYLIGTFDTGSMPSMISIYKSSDYGESWGIKKTVPVRSKTAYFRSIIKVSDTLVIAYVGSSEFSQTDRQARVYFSRDKGETWEDCGEPFINEFGNMNAIYDAALIADGIFLLGSQPDSNILLFEIEEK